MYLFRKLWRVKAKKAMMLNISCKNVAYYNVVIFKICVVRFIVKILRVLTNLCRDFCNLVLREINRQTILEFYYRFVLR
jgi:hypothetical protein